MGDVTNVSMREYLAFPTMIYKFTSGLDDDIHSRMSYGLVYKDMSEGVLQTKDNLYRLASFKPFLDVISHVTKNILEKLDYEYEKIEITGMWGNKMKRGENHPPHTHSNNFLSGVYYLKTTKDSSPIQFFDPKQQSTVLQPKGKPNWNTGSMVQFDALEGTGLIFPAWLMHWVPPTQSERTSISWNVILRGDYGSRDDYQYANI